MQLANPIGLLVLGFIPLLIFIHSLRPKPRQIEVTNLFLWRAALEEKGGLRFQVFITNLHLLLQILAVLFAALALAEPVWKYTHVIKGNVILVIDTSASMKTRTTSGIRFDQAREKAFKIISDLPKGSQMLIIESNIKPVLKSNFSNNKSHLKKVIENAQPSDAGGRIEKAIILGLKFVDPDNNDLIFVITDGAATDIKKIETRHKNVIPILVSGGSRNIGIAKFNFRQSPGSEDQYEMMIEVQNFTSHPVIFPMRILFDKKTFVERKIGLDKMELKRFIFPFSGPLADIAEASIEVKDDFTVDNKAYCVLGTYKDVWILLVTKGNYFLEKLLDIYPNFRVNSMNKIMPSSWIDQTLRNDIIILDGLSPPSMENGNFLLINSFSPSIPIFRKGYMKQPEILDWDRSDPLLSNLDLSDLIIESASIVATDIALKPLIESRQSGLMYSYQEKGLRAVFLGFDVTKSDLPMKIAFPVLMSNIFQWLKPGKLSFSSRQIRAGESYAIQFDQDTEKLSIITPSGNTEEIRPASNPFNYANTLETGIYIVKEKNRSQYFAVNLLDNVESDIRIPNLQSSNEIPTKKIGSKQVISGLPLWPFLLFPVVFVLIIEWYIWFTKN
jgi:hypothetical protein